MAKTIQSPPELPPAEELAQAITDIAVAARRMMSTRLKERTVILLLSEMSGVNRSSIKLVLDNLQRMDSEWLKPVGK